MHVRSVLIAVAVSGAAFYALGRYGQVAVPQGSAPPVIEPALAQGQKPPEAPRAAAPSAGEGAPNRPAAPQQVDETALRYFAAQGDTRRYEAELARLRALYPEWKPPTDLTSQGKEGDPELDRMWKLFAEGKYGEVRAAIVQRSTVDPGWRPPAELSTQLDTAEARQRLVNASNARQWEQVIRLGTETPAMLTCASVDALWRVAEAFVQTGKPERARDAYAYVLTNCTNPVERVGTMQKALATLPEGLVGALLAQERQDEFASIRDELARRHIGKAADDPSQASPAEDIQRIEALANAATTPDDAILLGFYTLHHDDAAKAATWFQTALARKGGAKAAEGAVLALGATKRYQEAEALGAQWLEADAANRKAYLDVVTALLTQEPPPRLDRGVIERIVKTVGTDKYAPGAGALGWYAYNAGQIAPAGTWFETALSWDRGYEPAAYGLALVRERQRDQSGLRSLVAEWGSRSQRIVEVLDPHRGRRSAPDDIAAGRRPVRRSKSRARARPCLRAPAAPTVRLMARWSRRPLRARPFRARAPVHVRAVVPPLAPCNAAGVCSISSDRPRRRRHSRPPDGAATRRSPPTRPPAWPTPSCGRALRPRPAPLPAARISRQHSAAPFRPCSCRSASMRNTMPRTTTARWSRFRPARAMLPRRPI